MTYYIYEKGLYKIGEERGKYFGEVRGEEM